MPKPRRRDNWYGEYLASSHWRRTRDLKLAAAGYRCERCGEWGRRRHRLGHPSIGLHVHHLTYERVPGGEFPTDLEVLCEPCHQEAHGEQVDEKHREQTRTKVARWIASKLIGNHHEDDIAAEIEAWDKVSDSG